MDKSLMERMEILKMTENTELPNIRSHIGAVLYLSFVFKQETDITTDVLIVGGGISGITSAYLLAKQGVKATFI
ncbi:FAD-dependent monooxygenase [Peribacillus butanolivorans]|uniref:FAD-dependent monooxygenase n=1 Tax=Peribacillus butanolivorans TaxID=421767 RepID=UPI00382948E7